MSYSANKYDALYNWLDDLCDGSISPSVAARLDRLLRADPAARREYLSYLDVHAGLGLIAGKPLAFLSDGPAVDLSVGMAVELPLQPESRVPSSVSPVPPIILDLSAPLPSSLTTSHYPLTTTFVGGPVFSYMVATVIVGMMLLGAWAYKITHYQQSADKQSPSNSQPEMQFVGHISGMKDCRWSDPQTETYLGASAPLGRRYALASGLMEITYKSGAKIILEGPCTYEVESRAGGYLSLGKLTARVGERGEGRGESATPQTANPKSQIPNLQISSSFIPHPSSFVVRTPTALVIDLGTEFGVEVSKEGNTTSHVFRGSVKIQVVGNGQKQDIVLQKNESARVEKSDDGTRLLLPSEIGVPPKFVRRLVEPPKVLDLLDIVAGGNGTGNRRERGIDPTTGMEDPIFVAQQRRGNRQYWPVSWHKLIDGVFVPNDRTGPVRIDSAGHTFDRFPHTLPYGETWGSIWARAAEVEQDLFAQSGHYWIYAMGRGEQFMPDGRGLLGMHSTAGITFDLEAIRRAHPDVAPFRFRAVAGMADVRPMLRSADAVADVWIFVDGELKLERQKLRLRDGAFDVDVKLGPSDRFLTLVVTDGAGGIGWDCVVFGDPVLQMVSTEPEKAFENRKEGHPIKQ